MPVNLSIKNAPDDVVWRLKQRAGRNHRSLQGELLAIIEEAVREPRPMTIEEFQAEVRRRGLPTEPKPMTVDELLAEARRLGIATPSESAEMMRKDRDER